VRSTIWTLTVFVAGMVALSALGAHVAAHRGPNPPPGSHTDPLSFILGFALVAGPLASGLAVGPLAICVLGVLVITGEYSSGTIRVSALAAPRRVPILAAKCAVLAALVFATSEVVVFGAFFMGRAIVAGDRITLSLSQPNVIRALVGAGLYLSVLGLFALAVGALVRYTAGAITIVITLVLVISNLNVLPPGSWAGRIYAFLPTAAGLLITNDKPQAGAPLSAWQGIGVFCGWTVLLLTAGAWLLRRRDARAGAD
jgi:ABC-type transport system involved in multi-copper enzyme maturation permease subunit